MKAFILAGGFGSKLREIIYNQPKILATIKGQPFIDHLYYLLKKRGFNEVILGLGYLGDMVKDYVVSHPLYQLSTFFSMERRPMGTAGALKLAQKYLDEPFFVFNGDTYLDTDYSAIWDYHHEKQALMTIVTAKQKYEGTFAGVKSDKQGLVSVFGPLTEDSMVHAGIYLIDPKVLTMIPDSKRYSLEKEVMPELIRKDKVYVYHTNEQFYDIGDAQGYKLAQMQLER